MTILMYFHCFFLKMLICVCVFNHTVYTEHSLLVFVFFLAVLCGLQDLSSSNRD